MKEIYLNYLTEKKDAKKLAYDVLEERTNISRAKLQRIFTGQVDVTVSDLETIVEKGFDESTDDLYARMGKQEFWDAKEFDYKGAKELISDFNAEKAQIREEYENLIGQSIKAREDAQTAFSSALETIGDQYRKNADYLTGIIKDNESYIRDLLVQTADANAIAASAQKRAEDAEKDRESSDKRRHQVFWCMILLVFALLGIIIASFVLNIPAVGWGNP